MLYVLLGSLTEGRGGFSRSATWVWSWAPGPYVNASACWQTWRLSSRGSTLRSESRRFSLYRSPQFLYASRKRRRSSGSLYVTEPPQAAWPNCLNPAIYSLSQCESRQFPRVSGHQDPNKCCLISPIQQSVRLRYYDV